MLDEAQMVRSITSKPAKLVSKLYRVTHGVAVAVPLVIEYIAYLGCLRYWTLIPFETRSFYDARYLPRMKMGPIMVWLDYLGSCRESFGGIEKPM